MRKTILTIIILFLLPLIVAEESFIFKQYSEFTLDIAMANNNLSDCLDCSCSYSIFYPNGSSFVRKEVGTNTNGFCVYSNTALITGIYGVQMDFNNSIDNGKASFDFEVTPTGIIQTSILDNPIFLILGVLGLILVIFGATKGIPWFGFIGSILFLLLGIYTMIYGFNNTTDLYTRGVAITLLGMGFIFMFAAAYEWLYADE